MGLMHLRLGEAPTTLATSVIPTIGGGAAAAVAALVVHQLHYQLRQAWVLPLFLCCRDVGPHA